MDNDFPYRTPFINNSPVESASFADERNYDSLLKVYGQMGDEMAQLLTISSIDISKSELTVKQQIAVNQGAYDLLLPIYQSLETAIGDVKSKQEQRY